jgi:N-acetylglutamate synthase-like GNAT family acetyltransferase
MGQGITVRRAKPGDADVIASFVNRARRGQHRVDRQSVIERFGSVGFLLAEQDGGLVGMLGWQVENLVVRITDFLVGSASHAAAISEALLSEMEKAAKELQCEVALLFLPHPAPAPLVAFCEGLGYQAQAIPSLPKAWQDAAQEAVGTGERPVYVKPLSDKRVIRPL